MPVNTTHPEYDKNRSAWQKCRDVIAGADSIKDAGSTYLPLLGNIAETDTRYLAYKTRAKWLGATARTIEGLEGEVFRNPPQIILPAALDPIAENFTLTGQAFTQFTRRILRERLIMGRVGELVDYSEADRRTYSIIYAAENIINWREEIIAGQRRLVLVVLTESTDRAVADVYSHQTITRYRVLQLIDGVYTVTVYEQGTEMPMSIVSGPVTPTVRGSRLDHIPFFFYGVTQNMSDIEKPPLNDLMDLNVADYRNSADLEWGRHFCGCPFYYILGAPELSDDNASIEVGSSSAFVSQNENAKPGIVEFTGDGLGALERAREENAREMAMMGARIIEAQKLVGETADAIARRQSGKLSVLQSIVEVQDDVHEAALREHAAWMGAPTNAIECHLNRDYLVTRLSAQDLTALVSAWQAGTLSKNSVFHNLQQGEIIPMDRTFEEEQALIEAEMPAFEPGMAAGG